MQPGPRGGDLAIGDTPRQRGVDPAGEAAFHRSPLDSRRLLFPFPHTVADTMSPHKRRPSRGRAPSARPPREPAPALTVLKPDAAGIDVHADMHMVCVPADRVTPASVAAEGGLPPNVRRFGAKSCDLAVLAEWLASSGVRPVD